MRRRSATSITARLAVVFGFVVLLTFALVGYYLYRSLSLQLALRDDSELLGKVVQIRHLLQELPSAADIQHEPHPFLNAVYGHEGLMFLIIARDGQRLIESGAWPATLPRIAAVALNREPALQDIQSHETEPGPARLIAARASVGRAGADEIQIFIARGSSPSAALLSQYGRNLVFAGVVGALAAALLGYATVRRGLRPIGTVAKKANEITSRHLDTRLEPEEAPTELRELTTAFNAMLDRLEDGFRRLAGFAADLAHDLRTPLHALRVQTEVALSRQRSAEEYNELLASNMEEYERLSRLIENTLFLARADNAQLAVRPERIDLSVTLAKIAEYFRGLADEAGVACDVAAHGVVWADAVLLDRAVSNLISNAIRHTEAAETIRIATSEEERFVAISVENPGAGIPAEQLERVFDRYFRGDASRGADGSTGLGLAIVRAIMKLHGGTAEVTIPAAGTTRFTLHFPRKVPVEST